MNKFEFDDKNGEHWKAEIVSADRRAELEAGVIDIEDEDSRVAVDLNDAQHPINVERDGWMSLPDAKRLLRLVATAIAIAERRYGTASEAPPSAGGNAEAAHETMPEAK